MRALMLLFLTCLIVVPSALAAPTGPALSGKSAAIDEIKAVFDNFSRVNSYKGRMTGSATGTFEWTKPSRMRTIMTVGGQTLEMIVIDGKAWMKSGGQCRAMPGGQAMRSPTEEVWGPSVASVKVTKGGTQTIDGMRTQIYHLESKGKDGRIGKNTTFVDLRAKLPRRIEVTEGPGGKMTIDYLEYNVPVTINPPC